MTDAGPASEEIIPATDAIVNAKSEENEIVGGVDPEISMAVVGKERVMELVMGVEATHKSSLGFTKSVTAARQRSLKIDRDIKEMAVAAIAKDFLNTSEMSLEVRAYLVETTLPTIVMALERLLKEVDRRKLVEMMERREPLQKVMSTLAPAAESGSSLEPQTDKPADDTFDPINWLAQFLYRNNPKYSDIAEPISTNYMQSIKTVGTQLKGRLYEMQLKKRVKDRADAAARKREAELQAITAAKLSSEKRAMSEQLLTTIFKKWTATLWRFGGGAYITKKEMMDAYQAVLQSTLIQSNDDMISKLSDMFDRLCMTPEMAERSLRLTTPNSDTDSSPSDNLLASMMDIQPTRDGDENRSSVVSQGSRSGFPVECLSMDRWNIRTYVDATGHLTRSWSIDELNVLLQGLACYIDGPIYSYLSQVFDSNFFLPKFTTTPPTPATTEDSPKEPSEKDQWKIKLGQIVSEWDIKVKEERQDVNKTSFSTDSLSGSSLSVPGSRRASSTNLANQKISSEAKNYHILKANLTEFCQGSLTLEALLGTKGSSSYTPTTAIETITGQEEAIVPADSTTQEPAPPESAVSEVEREYKAFMKLMAGLHGLEPFKSFMSFLRVRCKLDEAIVGGDVSADVNEKSQPATVASEDKESPKRQVLQKLFGIVEKELKGSGLQPEARYINSFIEDALRITHESSPILQPILSSLVMHVPDNTVITDESFLSSTFDKLKDVSDAIFDEIISVLTDTFELGSLALLAAEKRAKNPGDGVSSAAILARPLTHVERLAAQKKALEEIRKLSHEINTTVSKAADSSLSILAETLTSTHPDHHIRGRIALSESAVTHLPESPEGQAHSPGVVGKYLRFVACTNDLKPTLLNTTVSQSTGFEGKVMESSHTVKIDDGANDPVSPIVREEPGSPLASPSAVARFVGVPFMGKSEHKAVGVLGLTLTGEEDGGFDEIDVKFLEKATHVMMSTMHKIDARLKAITLAESSARYAHDMGAVEVEIYLNEPDNWHEGTPPKLFKVEENVHDDSSVHVQDGENTASSPNMRHTGPKVTLFAEESEKMTELVETIHTRTSRHHKESDGRVATYIPVVDDHHHVVAVMVIRPMEGKQGEVPHKDLEEVQKVVKVLSNAVNHVQKEHFGEHGFMDDVLEGEKIDEESRRKLLFPKMMLMSARDYLSKIDNRAISEIRSYKKPPVTVHRVLKAVLYIFGKLPKEVKKWADTVKMVNIELLQKMIAYDPTAIQKKIRFKRCARVLKLIPHGEVREKGSVPTMYMHDWLLVTLDLRQRAVEARQRRPEVFSMVMEHDMGGSAGGDGEEGDDEEGGMSDDAGSILDSERSVSRNGSSDDLRKLKSGGSDEGGRPSTARSAKSRATSKPGSAGSKMGSLNVMTEGLQGGGSGDTS
ncbi:EF-hand calcium-binding domain-containing protein 5 [Chytridiales sp. JEL 0842]|nr:EF-hand calcium-binding domain-containing protein 5 [Chytridiales sp. JEL 0842]